MGLETKMKTADCRQKDKSIRPRADRSFRSEFVSKVRVVTFHLAPGMWDPKDNDGGSGKPSRFVTEVMELKKNKGMQLEGF
jgi:hypothetical protein